MHVRTFGPRIEKKLDYCRDLRTLKIANLWLFTSAMWMTMTPLYDVYYAKYLVCSLFIQHSMEVNSSTTTIFPQLTTIDKHVLKCQG